MERLRSSAKYFVRNGQVYVKGVFGDSLEVIEAPKLPYCFVHVSDAGKVRYNGIVDKERTELKFKVRGGFAVRIDVEEPSVVQKVRDFYTRRGVKIYEADIPYVRRLLIDNELVVEYSMDNVAYVDVEVDDSKGFPKEYGKYRILSIAVYDCNGKGKWFYVGDYENERCMLQDFAEYLESNVLTIIAGWNVSFDYNHLVQRCKVLGCRDGYEWLRFSIPFDLKAEYEKTVKGLESYSLEEVSEHEGYKKKQRLKKVSEMTRQELEEYNMYDAELCYLIDKDKGFCELVLEIANEINLTVDMLSELRIGDTLILRRLRELGYVAEGTEYRVKKGYQGGWVKEPEPGVHRNVIYADFTSMYPSIIVNEKVDIEGFNGEVLPYVVKQFMDKRKYYKKMYEETGERKWDVKQKAMKPIINGLYGLLGMEGFRYFDEKKASFITAKARELVQKTDRFIEEVFKLKVVYADTDGLFIKVGDRRVGNMVAFAELILKEINEYIKPYEIKFEDVFKVIAFAGNEKGGVKKRYVGITLSGEWVWKGFEVRRGDWPRLVKEVQKKVAEMMFEGKSKEEIIKWLLTVKERMWKGEYDDKLIIVKGLNKSLEEYQSNQPYVRALKKALKRGWVPVDGKIKFVWYGMDVEPIIEPNDLEKFRGKLNYRYYWEMVKSVAERLLSALEVERQAKLF